MQLNRGIPVKLGGIKGVVYGGKFRDYKKGTRRLVGVKMAMEIDHPHEISIPTKDFSIPSHKSMEGGLIEALEAMKDGNDVYAGCMGGIGRTGLFMGCMTKLMMDYNFDDLSANDPYTPDDPVAYVRAHYSSHAIETEEQMRFVRTFDTSKVLEWVESANAPVVKEVMVYPWTPIVRWFFGKE